MQDTNNNISFGKSTPFITALDSGDALDPKSVVDVTPPTTVETNTPEINAQVEKTFTQAELDKHIQDRMTRLTVKHNEQLEQLKASVNKDASEAEAAEFKARIEKMRVANLDTEESYKQRISDLEKSATEAQLESNAKLTHVNESFDKYKINHELTEAAVAGDAYSVNQIVTFLKGDTSMKETLDEQGNPTGVKEVRVELEKVKEDGTRYVVELSPSDAIASMREMKDKFGNLFRAQGSAGAGLMSGESNTPKSEGLNYDNWTDYKRSREDNLKELGIK